MTIIGLCGEIGSGKSHMQLKHALRWCNRRRKRLVTNFAIKIPELKKYAKLEKLPWVTWLCDNNQIAVVDTMESVKDILSFESSVVCLDEAGIFLNSREFAKTPKGFLMDLAQSRKTGTDLVYCAQFDDQVDKQFRMLTQYFVHCQGMTKYDKALRLPKLYWKIYWHFTAIAYWGWLANQKARTNVARTWVIAHDCEWGFLSEADKQLFKVFDSKARLDKQAASAASFGVPNLSLGLARSDSRLVAADRAHLKRMSTDYNYLLAQDLSEVKRFLKRRKSIV